MLEVVKELPVPNEVPPVADEYQLTVPALGVAYNVTLPVPHLEPFVEVKIVGTTITILLTDESAPTPNSPNEFIPVLLKTGEELLPVAICAVPFRPHELELLARLTILKSAYELTPLNPSAVIAAVNCPPDNVVGVKIQVPFSPSLLIVMFGVALISLNGNPAVEGLLV